MWSRVDASESKTHNDFTPNWDCNLPYKLNDYTIQVRETLLSALNTMFSTYVMHDKLVEYSKTSRWTVLSLLTNVTKLLHLLSPPPGGIAKTRTYI